MNPDEIVRLPTESLYKFMALVGIAILVLTVGAGYVSEKKLSLDIIQAQYDQKLLQVKIEKLSDLKDDLKSDVNRAMKKKPQDLDMAMVDQMQARTDQTMEEVYDISIATAKLDNEIALLRYYNGELKVLFTICILSLIAGSSLTYYGFKLWYTRIQVYQDRQLKKLATGQ